MKRYERLWERLLTLLGTLGEVEERPGRLVLTIDGLRLELVVTEDQWEELVSVLHGSFTWAARATLYAITSALQEGHQFLVYENYELCPSDVPELPDRWAEFRETVEEERRTNPDATFGWSAHRPGSDPSP